MNVIKLSILCLPLTLVACGPAPDMPIYNDGTNSVIESARLEVLNPKDEKIFYLLPPRGGVIKKKTLWSGFNWNLNQGSINLRWNTPTPGWDYDSPHFIRAFLMSAEQLAELSPAEKFDLAFGRYDYPLKKEVYSLLEQDAPFSEDLRSGWIMASIHHSEPTPKVIENPHRISIPFGSSDIKALLSYYYQHIHKRSDIQQMGKDDELDAGAFHVILANNIGVRNESFLVDLDQSEKVMGHPVKSYAYRIEEEQQPDGHAPSGSLKVLKIRLKVNYLASTLQNSWEPIHGTALQALIAREYQYLIYLNVNNEILGGKWLSEERPDFLWTAGPSKKFTGLLEDLGSLLND
ncbi:MAG: hypothetical protein NDI69_01245 [Bacteriovoracaceae bacterium]|nr:hypothetical protein [Bacteriovoracaceae bacterium]